MKNRLSGWTGIIGCILLLASSARAQTWVSSPGSGDWNTGTNWDTSTVPNSSSDIATFGTSSTTSLTLSANTAVDSVQFNSGASSYTISTNGQYLDLYGVGVINNSSGSQTLSDTNGGDINFHNSSTAANAAVTNATANGTINFYDSSTAGNSTIGNNGFINFSNSATAGNATILNNGVADFVNNSSAGDSSYTNNNKTSLNDNASLGTSNVDSSAVTSDLWFFDHSTAGSSTITSGGDTLFNGNATAGSAVITITGGNVSFDGDSTGGTAQFNITNSTAGIDISSHDGAVTLGSLQGTGAVHMGDNDLALGTGNQSTTFSGVLDDNIYSSSMTKLGTGTLTLTGANTYDGGTNIQGGTLIVDGTGQLGTGTVTDNAGLEFVHSASAGGLTYQIGIAGTMDFRNSSTADNAVIQNGYLLTFHDTATAANAAITNTGLLTFTDNSSTGSTTITTNAGGAVHLDLSSDSGSSRIIFNGGGSFDISGHTGGVTVQSIQGGADISLGTNNLTTGANGLNTTLSGAIGGSGGSLTKVGSGILTLSGTNTYDGSTSVMGGVLQVSADDNMGASTGDLDLNGGVTLRTLAGINSTRSVTLIGGEGTFDSNGFDSTMGGDIIGSGALNKTGSGDMTLSGSNSYSGGTQISGGTMTVANANGLGTATVLLTGGTLAVSGQLAVTWSGDYQQSAGTTLSLGLGGSTPGQWDSLNLSGTAILNGTLNLSDYNSYIPQVGDSLKIIYANNGLLGGFSALNSSIAGRWIPVYSFYDLTIIAIQPSFAALGLTVNQKAVGSALDSLYGDTKNDALLLTLGTQDAGTLRPEYDLISPEQLTAVYPALYSAAQSRALAIEGRLSGIVGVNAPRLSGAQAALWDMDSPMYADSGLQGVKDRRLVSDAYSNRDRTAGRWGSFLDTTEDLANIGDDANAAGYKFTVTGITAGVDYRISRDVAVGFLLGYDLGSSTSSAGGKLDLNAGHAGLYGGWGNNGLHLEGMAEAGLPNLTTTRLAYEGTATGTATGLEFSGWLNGGYDLKLGATSLGLYVGGQYTYVGLNSFTETGSTLPEAFPSQNQNDLIGNAGIRLSRAWKMGSMVLTPNLGVSYEHQFDGYQDDMTAALAMGGSSFTVAGPVIGQDDIAVGAGFNLQFVSAISAFIQYDGKFTQQNYDRQNFSGGVNIGF